MTGSKVCRGIGSPVLGSALLALFFFVRPLGLCIIATNRRKQGVRLRSHGCAKISGREWRCYVPRLRLLYCAGSVVRNRRVLLHIDNFPGSEDRCLAP